MNGMGEIPNYNDRSVFGDEQHRSHKGDAMARIIVRFSTQLVRDLFASTSNIVDTLFHCLGISTYPGPGIDSETRISNITEAMRLMARCGIVRVCVCACIANDRAVAIDRVTGILLTSTSCLYTHATQ